MAYNKIITSEGNVQFQSVDGQIINVHPFHIYTTFNEDTVSFILIAMPKQSGLAIFTSKASDLEVDGTVYTIEQLPNALSEAFAKAGAVARYEIVDELPTSGQSNTIYLVPKSEGVGYDEYIYVNGEWELIGDTDIELDRYVDKETFSGYTADTLVLINTVSGNVITESERAISAETALQEAINEEVSARTDADTALCNKIDGKVVELTQQQYDQLQDKDPLVLYVITDAVEVNMNDYYKKTETSGATEIANALNSKLDATAYTPTDLSNYYTKDETSGKTEIATALNGKQETLVAGSGITISGNVINAEAQPITVDPSLDSGSTNAVANSAITNAINSCAHIPVAVLNYKGYLTKITAGGESSNNFSIVYTLTEYDGITKSDKNLSFNLYPSFINGKRCVSPSLNNVGSFNLVETSAITTSVTSASTDSQIPSAKAVYDALGGGSSYTAGDGIDITNDVISVTGKVDTSSMSGYVTTDTGQIVTSRKIFTNSDKAIEFKQVNDNSKVGFSVKNSASSNNELAAFELRPNTFTVDGVQHPLLYFGHYRSTNLANVGVPQTVIGFRQYDQKNAAAYHYLMPLPEKAKTPFSLTTSFKDYYAPLGFKNGSTMITADNTGVVDLSSELGGMKIVKLTESEYTALVTKDESTLYVVVPDPSN